MSAGKKKNAKCFLTYVLTYINVIVEKRIFSE